MKTENTLRMARNSLLCFFMALGAGFLVACGGGGGGGDVGGGGISTFPAYLVDAPVEGAEYSGPTRPVKDVTGKDGEFEASEGVFEFSVGATTLGSVRLSSRSAVTPADFIGVDDDEAKAIEIARIMQALDFDGDPQNGISISQSAREGLTVDLFARLTAGTGPISVTLGGVNLTIPPVADAEAHFVATRRCLFSGGYAGSYRVTSVLRSQRGSIEGPADEGQSYFALEPFANRIRGVESSNIFPIFNDVAFESFLITVGAIGSTITLSEGNELSFVTSRLVTGIWTDGGRSESGTYSLALVTGNPGANRRIVGVDVDPDDNDEAFGLYVLDYFAGGDDSGFRGQYYDVATGRSSALLLTIASGGPWPTDTTATELVLSGTLGGDATAVTVQVIRNQDSSYGTFTGDTPDGGELSGTWCDIGGASGVAVPPPASPRMPSAPSASIVVFSDNEDNEFIEAVVTWSAVSGATSYKLYRSESSGEAYARVGGDIYGLRYWDFGVLSADTEYFYQLEACNSGGCSGRSPEVSTSQEVTPPVVPQVTPPPVASGQCRVGQRLTPGDSCTWLGHTILVKSDGDASIMGPSVNMDSLRRDRSITTRFQHDTNGGVLALVSQAGETTWTVTSI